MDLSHGDKSNASHVKIAQAASDMLASKRNILLDQESQGDRTIPTVGWPEPVSQSQANDYPEPHVPTPLYPNLCQLVISSRGPEGPYVLIGMSPKETIFRQHFEFTSSLINAIYGMLPHMEHP